MNNYNIPFRETEDDIIINILQKINLQNSDIFIDIGCGNGIVIELVKKMYPNVECIGIEIDTKYYIESCTRLKNYNKVKIIQEDLRTFDWSKITSDCNIYYYMAWTKIYLNDFNFNNLKNSTLIIYKHELQKPEMKYYDIIKSNIPYNHVYFYRI